MRFFGFHLSFLYLFGAFAYSENVKRGSACPYASKTEHKRSSCPYAKRGGDALSVLTNIRQAKGKQGVFFMNRIAPGTSKIYIADADGSNEQLLLGNQSVYDYHAQFTADGKWITFTSERNRDGNSDIYRVRPDGSGIEKILATSSFEDAAVLSPDNSKVAYVSTANGYKSNIWVMNLSTGEQFNLTNTNTVKGNASLPDGYFRPAWSPDGQWIAFSSDRNTQWRGHGNGTGWEHTQELSVYIIRSNGTDFRQVATKSGYCLGSPKWSPDGKRIVYYEITTEDTWDARRPESVDGVTGQIVSVDVATGSDRVEHTSGSGLKMNPQYISNTTIGFLSKGNKSGINYTSSNTTNNSSYMPFSATVRDPAWSPDGSKVIYQKTNFTVVRPQGKELYSWQEDWEYRFTDVFPQLSLQGKLAITQKQNGNSSVVTENPDGRNARDVFNVYNIGNNSVSAISQGLSGAFQPAWSPDGNWLTVGLGSWFQSRATGSGNIYRFTANGSYHEELTFGDANVGFPSFSADGRYIVYRAWGGPYGLRIMDLTDRSVRALTNRTSSDYDNVPFWSPDGESIVFTRRVSYTNFDICTVKPDGTMLQTLTTSGGNDAHAVWTHDGRIMYSTAQYGFREEAAAYDDTFQPYGQIMIMNKDGSDKRILVDSMWEDSMPLYVPNEYLS